MLWILNNDKTIEIWDYLQIPRDTNFAQVRLAVVVLYVFWVVINFKAQAQDFHYSLINNQPLVLNPALTGVFDFDFKGKDLRFSSLYRQQTVSHNFFFYRRSRKKA